MGIFPAVQRLLAREHAHSPITGDVLLIGRQDVYGTALTDLQFFGSFSPASVKAIDVSDFEGADILHDLCRPVPRRLREIADFIFDGSCLDNIWDPPQALRNISAMLRPGGRALLFEHATLLNGSLTCFSPEWFFDFFAVNGYADCQIRLGVFPAGMHKSWRVQEWTAFRSDEQRAKFSAQHTGDCFNIVLAEKGEHSTDDEPAVQAQYRDRHAGSKSAARSEPDIYLEAHRRFARSARREWLTV